MFGNLTTDDFFYHKADGNVFPEGQASWDAVLESYQFFSKVCPSLNYVIHWLILSARLTTCHTSRQHGNVMTDQDGILAETLISWQIWSDLQVRTSSSAMKVMIMMSTFLLDSTLASEK